MKVQIKVHMSLNGRDNAAMRSWALKNGHYVAAYGMIPYDIQDTFKASTRASVEGRIRTIPDRR